MNVESKYRNNCNGFGTIATIAMVLVLLRFIADILASFYYKELIEIDANLAFSIWHLA